MASWKSIYNDPKKKDYTEEQWTAERKKYFRDNVVPKYGDEQLDGLWKEFNAHADSLVAKKADPVQKLSGEQKEMSKPEKAKALKDVNILRDYKNNDIENFFETGRGGFSDKDFNDISVQNEIIRAQRSNAALSSLFAQAEAEGKDPLDALQKAKNSRRGVLRALKESPGGSIAALFRRSHGDPVEPTEEEDLLGDYQPESLPEKIVYGTGTAIADLPFYAAGGIVGGLSGGPLGAGMGAMGLPAGLRKVFEARMEGKLNQSFGDVVSDPVQWMKEGAPAIRETGLGALEGAIFHGAGAGAGRLARNAATNSFVQKLGAERAAEVLLRGSAETGVLAGSQYLREGEVKPDDLVSSLVAMKLAGKVQQGIPAGGKYIRGKITERKQIEQIKKAAQIRAAEELRLDLEKQKIAEAEGKVLRVKNEPPDASIPQPGEEVALESTSFNKIMRSMPKEDRYLYKRINRENRFKNDEKVELATRSMLDEINQNYDPASVWNDFGTFEIDSKSVPGWEKLNPKQKDEAVRRVKVDLEKRFNDDYHRVDAEVKARTNDMQSYLINELPNEPLPQSAGLPGKPAKEKVVENLKGMPDYENVRRGKVVQFLEAAGKQPIDEAHDRAILDEAGFLYGHTDFNKYESRYGENTPIDSQAKGVPITNLEANAYKAVPRWGGWSKYTSLLQTNSRKLDLDTNKVVKGLLLDWVRDGHYAALRKVRDVGQSFELLKQSGRKVRRKINDALLWQDPDGRETLINQGITEPPKLNTIETDILNSINKTIREYAEAVNKVYELIGEEPIELKDGYAPIYRKFGLFEEVDGGFINSTKDFFSNIYKGFTDKTPPEIIEARSDAISQRLNEQHKDGGPGKAAYSRAKERTSSNQRPVYRDAYQSLMRFVYESEMFIHRSPIIAKNRALIENVKDTNPVFYHYGTEYLNNLAGAGQSFFRKYPLVEKIVSAINKGHSAAVIAYNHNTILQQPAALIQTVTEYGANNTAQGVARAFIPEYVKKATEMSRHLSVRFLDVSEIGLRMGERSYVGQAYDKIVDVGMLGIREFDKRVAIATWWAAYEHGRKKLGYEGRDLARYADEAVIKTQASGAIEDIAPIQRNAVGKAFTLFGTYGINFWNYALRDLAGYKNPNVSTRQAAVKMAKFMVVGSLVNAAYQSVSDYGVRPPLPEPFTKFKNDLAGMSEDEQKSFAHALLVAAREAGTILPIGGKASTWGGKGLFGAPIQSLVDLANSVSGQKGAPPVLAVLGKLVGVPGTSEIYKVWRMWKKNNEANDYESLSKEIRKREREMRKKYKFDMKKEEEDESILEYRIPQ